MPLNKTKTDILLTLTELMYYCPHNFGQIIRDTFGDADYRVMTNKQILKEFKQLLWEYKKFPSKKGQTR